MKIYLTRHGEAVSPQVDPEIPLSPRGREDLERLAQFLGKNSFLLSLILHSSKLRTKQTAKIFEQNISPGTPMEEHPQLGPNAPIQEIVARIYAEDQDLMIVSHLPFLEKLTSQLVTSHENAALVNFQTGTVACLEAKNGNWIINWIIGTDQV